MKRYTATQARQDLSGLLDEAERGEAVVIERAGRRFQVVPQPLAVSVRVPAHLDIVDASVASGSWTWRWGPKGLRFARRPGRRQR
jgi:antitoxin (DNA-binding transcriptional repressor) of toxin-antitoxin stability system